MVNRNLEVKRLKLRRRGRFVRFDNRVVNLGDDSLSRQKIDHGLRVPGVAVKAYKLNQDKVVLNPKKDLIEELPRMLRLTMPRYLALRASVLLKDQDLNLKRLIFDGRKVKVFIFFDLRMTNIYLLKIDFRLDLLHKSCNFRSLEEAQDVYSRGDDKVPWQLIP